MRATKLFVNMAVVAAMAATSVVPAFADDHGKAPKKHGRHDNGLHKGWTKDREDDRNGWDPVRQVLRVPSRSTSARRQQTKNEWRNIAIGSGAVAILGLLSKDSTLTFVGAAGALYSAYRYEQDRKSQSRLDRTRAAYFSRPYFYRDGVRYDRRTVVKNGSKYYQFVRHG